MRSDRNQGGQAQSQIHQPNKVQKRLTGDAAWLEQRKLAVGTFESCRFRCGLVSVLSRPHRAGSRNSGHVIPPRIHSIKQVDFINYATEIYWRGLDRLRQR